MCGQVERQLCATWVNHQSTKELNLRAPFATSYCLRQRMMHFLQNFMYYIMVEVIEPNWHQLETQLKTVSVLSILKRTSLWLTNATSITFACGAVLGSLV